MKHSDCYSRLLIDNHITDHDPGFMSKFDPVQYAQMVKCSGFESAMVYAACHNGHCYYPTKAGVMHRNLNGRDVFGETVSELRKLDILPLAYCTAIYQRDIAREHPDWRLTYSDGSQNYRRTWLNCPNNSQYSRYFKDHLLEIAAYDVEGIFIDMTFWPGICVCHCCKQKYKEQTGTDIPNVINWSDPAWVKFQRVREEWLYDFANSLTQTVKQFKPQMRVTHQFSPVLLGWYYGQRLLAATCDYTSGDFYGGIEQQRLGTKVLAAFSKTIPYEFMTSRCVNLYDHTSTKSELELRSSGATTLANGGAYFFIDAINPDGTLEKRTYDVLKETVQHLEVFRKKIAEHKPVLLGDTGLYYSMSSHVNAAHNGISLRSLIDPANNMNPSADIPSMKELLGASVVLNRARHPYKLINADSAELDGIRTLIINDAAFMSEAQCNRIREFVRAGGTLIATGMTSYYNLEGQTTGNFALSDVFGVSYSGANSRRFNYLALDDGRMISCNNRCPLVKAEGARVLAKVAEPLFDPDDTDHFASYHSNPPGRMTDMAGLSINEYGKGKCLYLYSSIFAARQESQQAFLIQMLKTYTPASIIKSSNAPANVEITLLKSTTADTLLLCFVNYQDTPPCAAVHDIETELCIPDAFSAEAWFRTSDGQPADIDLNRDSCRVHLPRLETMEIIEIKCRRK